METRVLIAIALSLIGIFAYQNLVLRRLYPPEQQTAQQHPSPKPTTGAMPMASTGPSGAAVLSPAPIAAAAAAGPERTVEVNTDLYRAVFTSYGGRLKNFTLKHFRETAAANSPPYEMVSPAPSGNLPLGLAFDRAGKIIDDSAVNYSTDAPPSITVAPGQRARVSFSGQSADGLNVVKIFTLDASGYVFDIEAQVGGNLAGVSSAGFTISQSLAAKQGYYDIPEIQADVGGKVLTEAEKALTKGVEPVTGTVTYAGFGDRYFLSVYLPQSPIDGTVAMEFDGNEATARLLFPVHGDALSLSSLLYMGPKQLDVLEAVNPTLTKAIDFGWTGMLALVFLRALKLFHLITPNYGWDIILLTVAIRIALLPMSIKGQRSMMRLQRLQPQVERLREKFKEDKERLNREMVDLYKRNHVNPLGGCAPMALQLPIFFGLYEALLNAVELRHAPFIGWINDLTAPDCLMIPHLPVLPYINCAGIPVLVILMGLSTFLQQKMSPQSPDPNQRTMMMIMPVAFTLMFVKFPAGLTLYYFSSNVLGIIQQFILNREFRQLSPATA